MTYRFVVMQGDGVGPEITEAARAAMAAAGAAAGLDFAFEEVAIGFAALEQSGSTFPDEALARARAADGVLLGPVSHNAYPPRAEGGLNPSGELRKRLDLFANIRPARTRAGIRPRAGRPLDLVIVRENTEGFYADRNLASGHGEVMVTDDVAIALRRITRKASTRIAREAFRIAETRAKRVTAVHKANVMRVSCGLFLACCRAIARGHPAIAYDEALVDSMTANLVKAPERYDVILTTNMFGDILSDLAAELAGSLGLAASLNAGDDAAMAQAQHGSAPDIAGKNVANPTSLIGSAEMLLAWLAERHDDARLAAAAQKIGAALDAILENPETRTADLGGETSTSAFSEAVVAHIAGK